MLKTWWVGSDDVPRARDNAFADPAQVGFEPREGIFDGFEVGVLWRALCPHLDTRNNTVVFSGLGRCSTLLQYFPVRPQL